MSTEANKAFVRRFFEVMDSGDWDTLRELMHPEHDFRFPLAPGPLDREGHLGLTRGFTEAFSDFQHIIHDQIAEDDKVVTGGTVRVRHTGAFNGIPPTGKVIDFGFINIMQIADGQNYREWDELNGLHFMQELGAVPAPS